MHETDARPATTVTSSGSSRSSTSWSTLWCIYTGLARLLTACFRSREQREQEVQTDKVTTFTEDEMRAFANNMAALSASSVYLNDPHTQRVTYDDGHSSPPQPPSS